MRKQFYLILVAGALLIVACKSTPKIAEKNEPVSTRWTSAQAQQWASENGWLCGSNFNPSTAINQLETWQAETFDTVTIDRELDWAQGIGMNVMRVYLHHLAWQVDKEGFKKRMDTYLTIANKHIDRFEFTIDNPGYLRGQGKPFELQVKQADENWKTVYHGKVFGTICGKKIDPIATNAVRLFVQTSEIKQFDVF
jgi:hypothetical protein